MELLITFMKIFAVVYTVRFVWQAIISYIEYPKPHGYIFDREDMAWFSFYILSLIQWFK